MVAATARPMKAAAFDYVRAVQLEQALELLELHGGDARLIAGGQSLVPMMAMRLARPALLVDINRIASLQSVSAWPR
jgi:CO/xanthine dehydrogenase FAD-binding subunit